MITLGTGIGSAVFVDGVLVPNTELGHIEIDGKDAETQASRARPATARSLSHKAYAKRLERYLQAPRLAAVAGPHHPRRRREQAGREVPAPPRRARAR